MPGIEVSKVMVNVGSIEELEVGGVNFVREDLIVRRSTLLDPENQPNQFGVKVIANGIPSIVCLCGSTRFIDEFEKANLRETLAGNIVLSIGCNTKSDDDLIEVGELTEEKKRALDELHKRKIDLADEVLILNKGGYVGDSTKSEIKYALGKGKFLRWLEPENAWGA